MTSEPPRFNIEILDRPGVRVIAVAGELERVLTLTGLDTLLTHYPDRVTAIDALRA